MNACGWAFNDAEECADYFESLSRTGSAIFLPNAFARAIFIGNSISPFNKGTVMKPDPLGKEIFDVRAQSAKELEKLLSSDPASVAKLYMTRPKAFAEVLRRAADHTAGGGLSKNELSELVRAFSQLPTLLARLLSGMGA